MHTRYHCIDNMTSNFLHHINFHGFPGPSSQNTQNFLAPLDRMIPKLLLCTPGKKPRLPNIGSGLRISLDPNFSCLLRASGVCPPDRHETHPLVPLTTDGGRVDTSPRVVRGRCLPKPVDLVGGFGTGRAGVTGPWCPRGATA